MLSIIYLMKKRKKQLWEIKVEPIYVLNDFSFELNKPKRKNGKRRD